MKAMVEPSRLTRIAAVGPSGLYGSSVKLRNAVEPAVRPGGCERSSLSGVRNCILEA